MFAFLVLAGAYLGWVRPETALAPGLRRLLDASVAAAVSVPLALGFRDELTRVANTSPVRDVDRLAALLAIVAATAFVAVLVGESLLRRSRADAPEKSGAGGRTDSESRSP